VKKAISVLKKRTGPHEESIRELRFDRSGIRLSQPLAKFQGILTGVPIAVKPEGTARSGAVEV
jgi:circadian clock protein KaiC